MEQRSPRKVTALIAALGEEDKQAAAAEAVSSATPDNKVIVAKEAVRAAPLHAKKAAVAEALERRLRLRISHDLRRRAVRLPWRTAADASARRRGRLRARAAPWRTHRPGELRDALASALGDRSLTLAYWLEDEQRYLDRSGRAIELPAAGSGRVATAVEHEGRRVAAVVHDDALCEEPELVRSPGAAAALSLENERLGAELRARLEELRASRARIVEAGDEARRRIERDLHDGAQQQFVVVALQMRLLVSQLERSAPEAAPLVQSALEELQAAIDELREVARGIHPAVLSERGLVRAVEALMARIPLPVELSEAPEERLPEPVEAALYYVISESLTNVCKHAGESAVSVSIGRCDGRAWAQVQDDGIGGARPGNGSGLSGLKDRVKALNGSFEVESPPGGGTTVRAELPCA